MGGYFFAEIFYLPGGGEPSFSSAGFPRKISLSFRGEKFLRFIFPAVFLRGGRGVGYFVLDFLKHAGQCSSIDAEYA